MKVWIDHDLCTGDGLCEEVCPSRFVLVGGMATVRGADGMASPHRSAAVVAGHETDAVLEAADDCPGECIFVEA
ncbi:MAG: ferredoxin [Acidimicrobiales bacterium]